MKHLNEIGRIKELMSLINEGEGLKFLERLLLRGETNSIKKAEGAIDDVFKVLDDETISKLESLGIRDATDLGTKLSSLSEDLAANVARGLMRNSNDYSKMFFNLLRNNDSYDTAIKGLEDLIEKNASKIKTQADVDKIIDTLGSKSGWDPVVIFNVKQNVKPKVNISDLIDTGADASKVMKNVYAVLGGEENYKMVMKYVLGLVGISAVIGFVPLGLGTKGMDWWNNRGKEPQFMDDELIKKIVNGTLDSDFETYFPEYSLAISDNFKTKLSTLINGIKTQTESPYELNLTDDYFKTIPDGFYLKYVLDYAKSQGVNYVKDDIIEQSIDNISKPFYIYKPLASINSETEFQSFEMNREELVKKYTTIKRKCPNETTWTDVTPSEDLYNVVNKSVIGYLLNKKKSSVKGAIDIVDKKAKDALGIDLESEVMTEDALKEKINKSLGSSPIFADDIKNGCEFNYSFLIPESKKGLINILEQFGPKKKDNTKVNKGNTSGGGVKTFPGPGTVQQFQDWLDTNYPTWLNGGKLNKGKGYGSYGPSTQKAFTQYGSAYQNSSSNSGGGAAQQSETVDKSKEIFDKLNDSVFFYSVNNERMNIEYTQQIGKWIKYYSSKKFNEESSYLGSVLSAYGNMISKYKTDEEIQTKIDTQLPNLQTYLKTLFEGIQLKRRIGLSEILEQVSNLVTVNVVNRIPQKQTEDDNYKDASSKIIKSVIGGGDEVRRGEKSDTVARIKTALGYTKDSTPYFTDDFDKFIIDYKGKNGLDNTNGNISKELICSIEQYKKLCVSSSSQKTTAPPTNTTTATPIELKNLTDKANAVGTGIPAYETCKSLFDSYSEQALNYRRLKKVNQAPNITDAQLQPIKNKILYCQKSSDLKDRAKLDTLISQRFRIQQDKDSPYYLDI
jgi:hypothetical protein